VVGRKLRLSPAESPPEEVGYTLTETTLELVNKEGTKQVLFRVEPAWYRPPNEKELEIIAKSFDDDPLFQIIQTIPELLSPAAGATLDNGCNSAQDDMVWDFDWSDVPNAAKFHLIVRKKDAVSPVIDVITNESFYHGVSSGGYVFDRNRYEWEWKVQAEVDGRFGAFSKVRKFDIEPINSDCR
jgi:hypothetical protein